MTVTITPRAEPQRTDLYDGIDTVVSDGVSLTLTSTRIAGTGPAWSIWLPVRSVALIALDEDPRAVDA